jgi:hypothetical protein
MAEQLMAVRQQVVHFACIVAIIQIIKKSYKKKLWWPPSKKKKRGKNLSPRNKKACHNIGTALM